MVLIFVNKEVYIIIQFDPHNFRFNRYADYYDFDGDWGYFTENIDEDKEQFYTLPIPLTTDEW